MASASAATPFSGKDIQKVITCNQDLDELNVRLTVNLPGVVTLGDQSSGKSSTIAAMFGIQLPCTAGLTNQCPLDINLVGAVPPETPWQCKLSTVEQYRYNESYEHVATEAHPLGRWQELPPCDHKKIEFATIYSPEQLARFIRLAQLANLNPHRPSREFVPHGDVDPDNETTLVNFSPNPVRLDIIRSGWPSLRIVDLPGVFACGMNVEEMHYKHLVDKLAIKYISNDSTLILLTIPMTSDFNNIISRSLLLREGMKDERLRARTMAVFTKPDCASEGDVQRYLDIVRMHEKFDFGLGCHVLRLSNANVSREIALEVEAAFFARDPWVQLEATYPGRLGVAAIQRDLQQVLYTKTQAALPRSLEPIDARVKEIDDRLKRIFPAPLLKDFSAILVKASTKFRNNINKKFHHSNNESNLCLRDQWDKYSQDFHAAVTSSQPCFKLRTITDRTLPDPHGIVNDGSTYTLDSMQDLYDQGDPKTESLHMTRQSIGKWNDFLADLCDRTSHLIIDGVMKVVGAVFNQYRHFNIYKAVMTHVETYVRDALEKEFIKVARMVENEQIIETRPPWVLDPKEFKTRSKAIANKMLDKRVEIREARLQVEIDDVDFRPRPKTKAKKAAARFLDPQPPKDFVGPINMAAEAKVYYDIAAFRLTQSVCLSMRISLLEKLAADLHDELGVFLGVNDPNQQELLKGFLEENSEITEERAKIEQERVNLGLGRQLIRKALGVAEDDLENDRTAEASTDGRSASIQDNSIPTPATASSDATNDAIPSRFRAVAIGGREPFTANPETPARKRSRDTFDESQSPETPVSSTKKQRMVTQMMARQSLSGDTPTLTAKVGDSPTKSAIEEPIKQATLSLRELEETPTKVVDTTPTRMSHSSSSKSNNFLGPLYDDSGSE